MLAVVILGSPSDHPLGSRVTSALESLAIPWEMHVASAHKTPRHLLSLLEKHEANPGPKVYITIAGRSNALSGLVDAQVGAPVIACPPYGEKFAGADLLSSLRTPSGVASAVVLEPENAALLAAKIFALSEPAVRHRIQESQERQRQRLLDADAALQE